MGIPPIIAATFSRCSLASRSTTSTTASHRPLRPASCDGIERPALNRVLRLVWPQASLDVVRSFASDISVSYGLGLSLPVALCGMVRYCMIWYATVAWYAASARCSATAAPCRKCAIRVPSRAACARRNLPARRLPSPPSRHVPLFFNCVPLSAIAYP